MTRPTAPETVDELPPAFVDAVRSLRAVTTRAEITVEETPAPRRLAPYAFALTADLTVDTDDLATGRLVLLHNPAGHEAWHGEFRLVSYVRADLEAEVGADPMVLEVGWSWLQESLAQHGAAYTAPSGTVTRVASQSFGAMAAEDATTEIEIRASWTPTSTDLGPHLSAWTDVLTMSAGVPPLPSGVIAMPTRAGSESPR